MRYELFDDDLGNYLIVDTWKTLVLGKASSISIGARMCQKLNKRIGSQKYYDELRQKYLTY